MAGLVRRGERELAGWEPLRLVRELMGWDPFAEIAPTAARWDEGAMFMPRFEVKEIKDAYVFKADLPGVAEKDLDITMTGNRITIAGKREAEERKDTDTFYAYERKYGSFTRSFTLPEGAEVEHCEAELRDGVLTLTVPKKPELQPKKVTIKALGEKVKNILGGKEKGQA